MSQYTYGSPGGGIIDNAHAHFTYLDIPKVGSGIPLGVYVGSPNGNNATQMTAFKTAFDQFVSIMGRRPTFMNAFAPYADLSNPGGDAYSWSVSGDSYVGPNSGVTPVAGVLMSTSAVGFGSCDTFFQSVVAGTYDSYYQNIVAAWHGYGYSTVHFRPGYEFNGNFMPWGPGNSSVTTRTPDFIAAFQHIYTVMHAKAAALGMTITIWWNPVGINNSYNTPNNIYPGDDYCDGIGLDQYSPCYALDFTNWTASDATGVPISTNYTASQAADGATWGANAVNRAHYWNYPSGKFYDYLGTETGWGMMEHIAFAKLHNKPIAMCECGAGAGSGSYYGPSDDPAFPQWLAGALQSAQAQGVPVSYANIWGMPQGDGDWGFLTGQKPQLAAAWAQYFA